VEQIAKILGFKDAQELNKLVSSVDISTPEKLKMFKDWQKNDGTKNGLCRLFPDGHPSCKDSE